MRAMHAPATRSLLLWLAALLLAPAPPAAAQQTWLQIEARPSPAEAARVAEGYAARLDDVQSFALRGSRWSAIVLGPYEAAEAEARRRSLRAGRAIPADSFATDGARFGERLFPRRSAETAEAPRQAAAPAGETRAEARRAERALSRAERQRIQRALSWAGHYDAAIDGAFGPGTRRAMAARQRAEGAAATGTLTTGQRAALLAAYDGVLDGLGLAPVTDEIAGIAIVLPTARVAFERHAPPFAHYRAKDGSQAGALLISMQGGRAELRGLYDAMQTLEIVPPEGQRTLSANAFTLTGRSDALVSHTEARVVSGAVKGFTLIWPAGDEPRRRRIVAEMRASFAPDPGRVMADTIGAPDESQSVDLLAGLRIRQPAVSRSGFYVGRGGAVLTTADAARDCGAITLDRDVEARVAAIDAARGLALLEPAIPLAPRARARFRDGVPRLRSEVLLSGFSYDGELGAPSLTSGTLAALRGPGGETDRRRYDLAARPGDAGGPVLDRAGTVLGMLASRAGAARTLPDDVALAIDVEAIAAFLGAAGLKPARASPAAALPRSRLEARAGDMTVHVACWE